MESLELSRLLGTQPRLRLEEIVSHPRLPQARQVYLARFLEVYGGDPFLVRLLIETSRYLVYTMVVVLEAAQDPRRRETWVTVGLLKQTLAMFGMASARQIDHLIARLCEVGYLETRPSPKDGRLRLLSATEKMRAHHRDWLFAHYAPLTALFPQHDYSLAMERDRHFEIEHGRMAARILPVCSKALSAEPDMLLFLNRAGGYMVLAALLHAAADDPLYVAVPYGDVSDRFGISRTQVRNLLVEAEERGLVKLQARGGQRVEILPRLWKAHDRGIARGMFLNDILYLAATRARHEPAGADQRPTMPAGSTTAGALFPSPIMSPVTAGATDTPPAA